MLQDSRIFDLLLIHCDRYPVALLLVFYCCYDLYL